MMCPATFAIEAAIRYEPPPKMKRRPCRGGASDFDPASLEMVSMNGSIIRRRKAPYKAAQGADHKHGPLLPFLSGGSWQAQTCFWVPIDIAGKTYFSIRLRGEWVRS
jgi:hypothetical protein